MRTSINLALGLLLAAGAVGCGGSDTGDMGGPGPDMNLTGQHLQSGSYAVSNVTMVAPSNDGCMIAPLATSFDLANTGQMLSLGKKYDSTTTPQFNPPAYALGTGTYTSSTTAMTSNSGITVTLSDGCTFMRTDMASFTFTGTNAAMVDWTHTESGFGATCVAADKPATDPCTSEFKFTITM
jgi:hypothetical protein